MSCVNPIQGFFDYSSGKKLFKACPVLQHHFVSGSFSSLDVDYAASVPCGQCITCRLARSRQVAVRALHESKMFEDNCFLTLTFTDSMMRKHCPEFNGRFSIVRKHMQDFMKRLRIRFARGYDYFDDFGRSKVYRSDKVRVLGCGEYGDRLGRPHYHLCLFGADFYDKKFFKRCDGYSLYNSDVLDQLWSIDGENLGYAVIGDFSFDTAAYVARYCTKKISGEKADGYYCGLLPEFPVYSLRPGLGADWFEKFKSTDFIPNDSVIVNDVPVSLPRYYDKLWERFDPEGYLFAKEIRLIKALDKADDNTYARLRVKEVCVDSKMKLIRRSFENGFK